MGGLGVWWLAGFVEGDPAEVEGFAGGSGVGGGRWRWVGGGGEGGSGADRVSVAGGEGEPGGVVGVAGDGEVAVVVAVMMPITLCRTWDYADCGVKVVGVQGFASLVVGIITGWGSRWFLHI